MSAGNQRDLDLDRRIPPGVEDLPGDDIGDMAHWRPNSYVGLMFLV